VSGLIIFTIGHATRPIDEFLALLRGNGVRTLVDIPTIPRSRHHPQFSQQALESALGAIGYIHLPGVGRPARREVRLAQSGLAQSSHSAVSPTICSPKRSPTAFTRLLDLAAQAGPSAIMCAEAVPWRLPSLVGLRRAAVASRVRAGYLGTSGLPPTELTRFAEMHGDPVRYTGAA
jgi:uncharacterized protein (DUF488 family)